MSAPEGPVITAAVEGDLDEFLLRSVVAHAGLTLGTVHGRKGKPFLLSSIQGYNNAARFSPWVVLIDLNGDADCAPEAISRWLPNPSRYMSLRVAIRAAEAWLLADRERIARWLGLSVAQVPTHPDELVNPKQALIHLARRSPRRWPREDLVPRDGSGRSVGPLYTARMIEFIQDNVNGWRPTSAILVSDSLARCVARLRRFAEDI